MGNRIKVLNINFDNDPYGGVPVFLINVYRNINHNRFQVDFLTPDITSYNPYREEIEQTGGHIFQFHISCDSAKGKISFGRRLKAFLKTHPYDIVHINSGALSFDCITTLISKSEGSKVIIHSHNAGGRSWWKRPVAFFMKPIMQMGADALCACSREAALDTFTSRKVERGEVTIIKNGIDLQKFAYNEEIRDKTRRELNLEGRFVVGHIGRFVEQKNHIFLIDIFAEIHKKEQSAILLLIGQGELETTIKEKVQKLNLDENVIFLGARNDIEDLYQAMDVLLFPSLFEGLPITLLEAQTSGLPCCISDTITKEVDLTDLIHRESLKTSPMKWAQLTLASALKDGERFSHDKELTEAGFDIKKTASQIMSIYESLV